MTKETLEKLDSRYKTFLDNRKEILKKTNKPDDVKGEIRGYLKALVDCGVISQTEFRVLYTYYTL
jgi:hypothetical protein